jgi:hypothetical protein
MLTSTVFCHDRPPKQRWPFLVPSLPISQVSGVYDPSADGHCGFRCLAKAIYGNEDDYQKVKNDMMKVLVDRKDFYWKSKVFGKGKGYDSLTKIISYSGSSAPPEFWFSTLDCGQLAADTYKRPIEIHHRDQALIFLPMIKEKYQTFNPTIMLLHASHYYLITLNRCRRHFPTIAFEYQRVCQEFGFTDFTTNFADTETKTKPPSSPIDVISLL